MIKRKIHKSINNNRVNLKTRSIDGYAQLSIPFITLIIIVGLISYVILTSIAVWNADKRTSYEKEIAQKSVAVIDLEAKLSSINKNITQELAIARGFIETHKVKYVTTKPLTTALRSNEMEL